MKKGLMHQVTFGDKTFWSCLTSWGHYKEWAKKFQPLVYMWSKDTMTVHYFWRYEHFLRGISILALRFCGYLRRWARPAEYYINRIVIILSLPGSQNRSAKNGNGAQLGQAQVGSSRWSFSWTVVEVAALVLVKVVVHYFIGRVGWGWVVVGGGWVC